MCMIDLADEPWAVYVEKTRRARKEYVCCECSAIISPGSEYFWAKGLYDRYWSVFQMCMACKSGPCAWLTEQCGGWMFHGVAEDLREHWDEGPEYLGITDAEFIGLGRLIIEQRRRSVAAAHYRFNMVRPA